MLEFEEILRGIGHAAVEFEFVNLAILLKDSDESSRDNNIFQPNKI
jgi:hypothetical protein